MSETTAGPRPGRAWYQFHVWHLFVLVTVVACACAVIKWVVDSRIAKADFYDAIQGNDLSRVQELLRRHPFLMQTHSPPVRVPGDLTIYSVGETPLGVAVMYESRDTFDYLMSLHPDLNAGGGADCPPLICAVCAEDIHYLEALLEHGADPSVRDGHGKTASDYARQFEKDDFLDLIASP
jgi:hypothetical protein